MVKCAGEHFFRALFTQPATLGLAGGHAGLAAEQPVLFAGEIQLGPNSELQAWTNVTGTYHFPEDLAQQSGLPADAFWAFQPSCNPANSTEAIALPGGHALVRSTHAASGVYANAVLHSPVRLPLKANSWCTHCTPVLYCVTNSDSAISCEHLLRAFNEVPLSKIGLLSYASACKVSARRDADPNSPDAVAPAASVASCSHIRQLHVDWAKGLEVARRSMCPNSVRQGDFRHMFREVEDKIPQKLCARGQARRREVRQMLLTSLQITRTHCTTLTEFHLFWTCLFHNLTSAGGSDVVEYLRKTYFFHLPVEVARTQYGLTSPIHCAEGILCAAWWGAYCRVQPGSASGTQSLEVCHQHSFRDALVDEAGNQLSHLPPGQFFSHMQEVLQVQGRQLRKRSDPLPDYPRSRDALTVSSDRLAFIGRSTAVELHDI